MKIESIFSNQPVLHHGMIYCFGNEQDGDFFDETDFDIWNNTDLYSKRCAYLRKNKTADFLVDSIVKNEDYVIDLATGPSMGFIPLIKEKSSLFCVASDANLKVLQKHSDSACRFAPMGFAQFSLLDIPFRDDSVGAYSSFIGISSTRGGIDGYRKAISEVYRTLKTGGKLYAVENEWVNVPQILELFKSNNKQPWDCFLEESKPWEELFSECGFKVLYNEMFEERNLSEFDNELGEMAAKSQVDIRLKFTGFILEKI